MPVGGLPGRLNGPPDADSFAKQTWAHEESILPLPPLSMPRKSSSRSGRIRQRFRYKKQVWRSAAGAFSLVNGLSTGDLRSQPSCLSKHLSPEVKQAQSLAISNLVGQVATFVRDRRRFGVTGGHRSEKELLALVKGLKKDAGGYVRHHSKIPQIPLIADRISEPTSEQIVPMLEALPADERAYYSCEQNVIDITAKSSVHLERITEQYAFYGGSLDEVIRYFSRENLPPNMWTWDLYSNCKAISGLSTVLKKDGFTQRKLLMACAFNYLASDAAERSRLGMDAAGALKRVIATDNEWAVSACDQSNAFTNVLVPAWMWPYQATPPLPAHLVYHLLPEHLRSRCQPHTLVSACYQRLPMGFSHAVHILMTINFSIIGRALHSDRILYKYAQPGFRTHASADKGANASSLSEPAVAGASDLSCHLKVADVPIEELGHAVKGIRESKQGDRRVFVVLNFVWGASDLSVEGALEAHLKGSDFECTWFNFDLGKDGNINLLDPEVFSLLGELSRGYVDVILCTLPSDTFGEFREENFWKPSGDCP